MPRAHVNTRKDQSYENYQASSSVRRSFWGCNSFGPLLLNLQSVARKSSPSSISTAVHVLCCRLQMQDLLSLPTKPTNRKATDLDSGLIGKECRNCQSPLVHLKVFPSSYTSLHPKFLIWVAKRARRSPYIDNSLRSIGHAVTCCIPRKRICPSRESKCQAPQVLVEKTGTEYHLTSGLPKPWTEICCRSHVTLRQSARGPGSKCTKAEFLASL